MKPNNRGTNICPHMNGNQCALEYCDYYNRHTQECSLATECKLNVELLVSRVKRNREKAAREKKRSEMKNIAAKRNIVSASKTMQ